MMTYRVGIVGCGGMGHNHARAYEAFPNVQLVAVADVVQDSLDRFAQSWHSPATYLDYREMFEQEHLDIVSITTWEDSHRDLVVAAAESGIRGILCEKPMAMNLAQADDMIAACDRAGAVLAIGHMRRYFATYQRAKELLDSGQLGEIRLMHAYCGGWGLFLWGTHYADMLHYLNDDASIEWLIGQISWQPPDTAESVGERHSLRQHTMGIHYATEDDAMGLMRFSNGVRAILETGQHSPQDWEPNRLCELTIHGTQGIAVASDRILRYRVGGSTQWVETERLTAEFRDIALPAWEAQVAELLDCMETGKPHQLDGRRGRAALALILGIYDSSRSRSVVPFPLTARDNPFHVMIESGALP